MYGLCRDSEPLTRSCVPGLSISRRDAIARELRDAVRLADVLLRLAVLVDGGDVQIAVRIARLVLGDRARDVDGLVDVEVRREAVMRVTRPAQRAAASSRDGVRRFIVERAFSANCTSIFRRDPSRRAVDFASVPR